MTPANGLRQRLSELLESGLRVGDFEAWLEDHRAEYDHHIDPESGLVSGTTCIAHALELHGNDLYDRIAHHTVGDIDANPEFMRWLIYGTKLSKIDQGAAPPYSTLVVYSDAGEFKHIGIWMDDGRVSSKLGNWPVYRHGLWELPSIYGDDVAFYRRPTKEEALDLFLEFARFKGLTDEQMRQFMKR